MGELEKRWWSFGPCWGERLEAHQPGNVARIYSSLRVSSSFYLRGHTEERGYISGSLAALASSQQEIWVKLAA